MHCSQCYLLATALNLFDVINSVINLFDIIHVIDVIDVFKDIAAWNLLAMIFQFLLMLRNFSLQEDIQIHL